MPLTFYKLEPFMPCIHERLPAVKQRNSGYDARPLGVYTAYTNSSSSSSSSSSSTLSHPPAPFVLFILFVLFVLFILFVLFVIGAILFVLFVLFILCPDPLHERLQQLGHLDLPSCLIGVDDEEVDAFLTAFLGMTKRSATQFYGEMSLKQLLQGRKWSTATKEDKKRILWRLQYGSKRTSLTMFCSPL